MATPAKVTICLWYDRDAEDAARFYAKTFPNSSVGAVHRAPGDFPSGKKGDALTFFNDDSVPHNIMSASKGNEFNLGSQAPGSSTDVTFKEPGDVQVICAIHPRMKMMVKVTD